MKATYKQKLFICFVVVFALFTAGIVAFEQSHDRKFRTGALQEKLDAYAVVVGNAIEKYPDPAQAIDSLRHLLPANLRITIVDRQGTVICDNTVDCADRLENHAARPEIVRAQRLGNGTDIRLSASNNLEYIYYARRFPAYFIRVAFPYDVRIRHFLRPDNRFLYFILVLLPVMLALINFVAGRFGKSIKQLREFALSAANGNINAAIRFPDDELGEIGSRIRENYWQIARSRKKIALEREKLLQHVHISGEGLCFFSHERNVEFYNGLFLRYLNFLTDGESTSDPLAIFAGEPIFSEIVAFLSQSAPKDNYFETCIARQGRFFSIQVNLFEDHSSEIIINDVTRQEKTRRLKQEMTGNIAHELRTPVTGIRGYLELALTQSHDAATTRMFTEKAFNRTLELSELIRDMSLISRIEETPQAFRLEAVGLKAMLLSLKNDLEKDLQRKNIRMRCDIGEDITVNGNRTLLHSIFRNLTDNVIRHAGENLEIRIRQYGEDEDFYYFTYTDTGVGISGEQHLTRLFERFYRVNEGRTRDTGGSGLGLSIVKNALLFHKGNIIVKNRTGGGLKFIFNLPKYKNGVSSG